MRIPVAAPAVESEFAVSEREGIKRSENEAELLERGRRAGVRFSLCDASEALDKRARYGASNDTNESSKSMVLSV